jgi:hypothetical protein
MKKTNKILTILGCAALGLAGIGVIKAASKGTEQTLATATAGTYTYDLVSNFSTYASAWTTTYASQTISSTDLNASLPAATIILGSANKQSSTSTIHDRPVSKASDNTFELTENGFHISSFSVTVYQWTTKTPSFDVYVDGSSTKLLSSSTFGLSTSGSTGTAGTSGDIAISGTATKKIHFQNTSSNQIGYTSVSVTIAADPTFGTMDHISVNTASATTEYKVGETFTSDGIVATAFDGADETTSSSLSLTATDLTFSHETTSLGSYVFQTADISNAFVVTVSYTKGSITKTATFNVLVEKAPFTTMNFVSATTGFFSATATGTSLISTTTIDGNRWTASITGSSTATPAYAPSANGSYFDEQFGNSSNPATEVTLRSGIIKGTTNGEVKVTKVEIVAYGASSSTAATISCKVGNTTAAETKFLSGNVPAKFSFDFSSGDYGHVEVKFSAIAKGLIIRSIALTGAADTSDTGAAYSFAHAVEITNGCSTTDYSSLTTAYGFLSASAKATAEALKIDDMADGQTAYAIIDRCTVADKLAAMKVRAEASGTNGMSLNSQKNNADIWAIVTASAIILGAGAFFYFRKKKQA